MARPVMKKKRKKVFLQKKTCRFCADKITYIDYKDVKTLRTLTTERGKVIPGRVSGNCAKHQRAVTRAIKIARNIALLPFTIEL
ncbi:MAG: 30S ribosomal protein S18 [Nitrospinota bacterium]|nr:30S ribosomal protein S18 [Nitrospinota bacterium]